MAEKKKEDRISIANVIALIGLAGLAAVMFYGLMLGGDSMGMAGIKTASYIAAIAVLLIMSIKFKTRSDNPEKWQIAGYVCVGVWLIVAVLCAKPFLRLFYVISSKEDLQQAALNDITRIDNFYDDYEKWRSDALTNSQERILQVWDRKSRYSSLDSYCKDYVGSDLNEWRADADRFTKIEDTDFDDIKSTINKWSFTGLSDCATRLSDKLNGGEKSAQKIARDKIDDFRENNHLIPLIDENYNVSGFWQYNGNLEELSDFAEKLRSDFKNPWLGILLYVVLHLLCVLNYLVVLPSNYVSIIRRNIGGLPLE